MRQTDNNNNLNLLEGELIATIILMFSVGVSALLIYDSIEKNKGNNGLYDSKTAYDILLINRFIILLIFIYYLYSAYISLKESQQKKEDIEPLNLQVISDFINVIAAILALYVTYKYGSLSNVSSIDEPVF